MDASPVKRLYKYYGLLAEAAEQGDKILEHEDLFNHIIDSRHGKSEEKRLAAHFIPKFCQYFPHLLTAALSAQLDLCEDSDVVVRKQAIKEITSLCRSNPLCVKRVSYFIAQLLGAEDVGENLLVRNTLVSLFSVDSAATLGGIFAQIRDGNSKVKERCKTFLCNRLGSFSNNVISDLRETLVNELEICLENSNSKEIGGVVLLIPFATVDGSETDKVTVEILEKQLSLEADHLTASDEDMKRISVITKLTKPHFSKTVDSGKFVQFYALTILPLIKEVDGYKTGSGLAATMLKLLFDVTKYCTALPDAENCFNNIFQALQELLPQEVQPSEGDENEKKNVPIHFTLIECLLGALLALIVRVPPSFDSFQGKLEELKNHLKLLVRYAEQYRKTVADADKSTLDPHVKSVSLRCLENLKSLSRQYFFSQPKPSNITPSWSNMGRTSKKTRNPSTASVDHQKKEYNKPRGVQQIYTPPGGKYSRSFKRF